MTVAPMQALSALVDAERRNERYIGYGQQPTFACRSGIRIPWRLIAGLAERNLVQVVTERDKFGGTARFARVTKRGRKAAIEAAVPA